MIKNTGRTGNYRWKICALLFFATTLNYLDRHVLSILAPSLQEDIGFSEVEYGYIVAAFQAAYGLGVIGAGKLLDRYGIGLLYGLAVAVWSLAGMAHALARSAAGFAASRFALGLGEAANFPAALKTIAEWFPEKERALAAGIFNAGSNVGAILSPLIVPWIALRYGWQWAFILVGLLGFIWLIFWRISYRKPEEHPKVSAEELSYIQTGRQTKTTHALSWKAVLSKKETLILCLVRFISDPTWWFLLYWLPKFLHERHEITLVDVGLPLIMIYLIADIGSITGGWLSSYFIKKNKSANFARKTTMLICALSVVPVIFAVQVSSLWLAVGLISLAAAGHCGWMANVYALISDVFPRNAIGTVTGLSTMSAVLGGMLFSTAVGFILEMTGNYFLVFLMSGFAYLIAWIVLRAGIPKIRSISF